MPPLRPGIDMNGDLLGLQVRRLGRRSPRADDRRSWPGKVKAGTTSPNQLIGNVDMLATFMALTGQNPETLSGKDSVNVLPTLLDDPENPIRKELLLAPRSERHLSIRKGKWMYIPSKGSGGFTGSKPHQHAWGGPAAVALVGGVNSDFENGRFKQNAPPAQFYDLEADVNQARNLYNEYPEVVQELEALLETYKSNASNTLKTDSSKQAGSRDGSASVSGTVVCTHSALEGIGEEAFALQGRRKRELRVRCGSQRVRSNGETQPGGGSLERRAARDRNHVDQRSDAHEESLQLLARDLVKKSLIRLMALVLGQEIPDRDRRGGSADEEVRADRSRLLWSDAG